MTNASFCLLWAFPPRGSAVRLKSRLRRYSASGASAAARDSAGLALAPRLVVLLRAVAFFGMCAPGSSSFRILSPRSQPRRGPAMPHRAGDRLIGQLLPGIGRSQQQATPTHVSPSHKVAGKAEALSQEVEQHVHVLTTGDAAQQNDVDIRELLEVREITLERKTVGGVIRGDVHRTERAEVAGSDRGIGRNQSAVGGDDLDSGIAYRRPGELTSVGGLAAKVEAAEKAERLAQGDPASRAKPLRQREAGAFAEENCGPLPAAMGWREQEDPTSGHGSSTGLPHTIPVAHPIVGPATLCPCRRSQQADQDSLKRLGGERLLQERQLGIGCNQLGDFSHRIG